MSTVIESLPIQFAGLHGAGRIPAWAKDWNVSSTTLKDIELTEIKPGIVVIQSRAPADLVKQRQYLTSWSNAAAAANPYVVVEFAEPKGWSAYELAKILRLFPGIPQVDFASGTAQLKKSIMKSMANYLVHGGQPKDFIFQQRLDAVRTAAEPDRFARKTATDALGEAQEVIAALRPLLASSGRLSAPNVATQFGLSTARLGQLIGSSRQALAKTPDASTIQDGLRPFERIARLRAVLSEPDFKAWLNRPNQHLDGDTPMKIIEGGRAGVVADLAESMLTGTPS